MYTGIVAIAAIFIGLPWLVMHYVTRWKTASTLTRDDEVLLEDLYRLARRLEERMETVERLLAADHPDVRLRQGGGRQDGGLRDGGAFSERAG